jgi:hypothetical protein
MTSLAGRRLLLMTAAAAIVAVAFVTLFLSSKSSSFNGPLEFTRVGQNGPVFTVSVSPEKASDDGYLMRIAEQLSAEQTQSGGSGQVSVMLWPNDVPVPKEPPTTEFDASMRTQLAGIFVNPTRNIKHLIRFKEGVTVLEKDFGAKTR